MENEKNVSNDQLQQEVPQSQPVMQESKGGEKGSGQVKYAGFWIRWAALFIDNIILQIAGSIIGFVLGMALALAGLVKMAPLVSGIFGLLILWAYFIFMTYKYKISPKYQ